MTALATVVIWISASVCLLATFVLVDSIRRARVADRRIRNLWRERADPVGPVEFTLKTGEIVTVQPRFAHMAYVWHVPAPARPSEIDVVTIPDLPPYTEVIPVPPDVAEWLI